MKYLRVAMPWLLLFVAACLLDRWYVSPLTQLVTEQASLELRPGFAQMTRPWATDTMIDHAQKLAIEFDVLAVSDQMADFFQTSDGPRAIRVEVQHPNQLSLALGDLATAVLSRDFTLETWHHMTLAAEEGKFVTVTLDGVQVYHTTRADLTHLGSYGFERLAIGYAQGGERPLRGAIRAWKSTIDYHAPLNAPHDMVRIAAILLLAGIGFWLLLKVRLSESTQVQYWPIGEEWMFLGAGSVLLSIGLWLNTLNVLFEKWNIALALGLVFLLSPVALALTKPRLSVQMRGVMGILGVTVLLLSPLADSVLKLLHQPLDRLVAAVPLAIGVLLFYRPSAAVLPSDRKKHVLRIFGVVLMGLFSSATVLSLQNWIQIHKSLGDMTAQSVIVLMVTATVVVLFSWQLGQAKTPVETKCSCKVWMIVPYLLFAIMAWRSDTLFVDGSTLHWEYFVGPLRTLRQGAWPLWDAPSQYGFLNVLLPSLLPVRGTWDAFYLFQGAVLLVAAGLFYHTLHRWLGANKWIACALVVASFFLAYPPLIGPAPFPSSSGVRFLWCYVQLYWAVALFFSAAPSLRHYVRRGAFLWVIAVLWSAESAVYATAIFMAPIGLQILLHLLQRVPLKTLAREIVEWIGFPLLVLGCVVAAMSVFYSVRLGHLPDFGMFFLYGTAYSGGFGAVPVVIHGVIWLYGFIIFTGAAGLYGVLKQRATAEGPGGAIIAAMACVWVVSSYYIGRAVTNNVIAEYPILCFSFAIIISATARGDRPKLSQMMMALPVFTLALMSPFWNMALIEVVRETHLLPHYITSHLDQPDPELATLMQKTGMTPDDAVVYYGFGVVMPTMLVDGVPQSFEKTWLPNPVQLLEEPISPQTRAEIVDRYLARELQPGFLIQKREENEDRMTQWLALLDAYYETKQTWNSPHYRIFYFVPRASAAH